MGRYCGFVVTMISEIGENGIPIFVNKRRRIRMARKSLKKGTQLLGGLIIHPLEAERSDARLRTLVNIKSDKELPLFLAQNRRDACLEKSPGFIVSGQSLYIMIEHFLAENTMKMTWKTFRLDGHQRRKLCGGNAAIAAKIISFKGLLRTAVHNISDINFSRMLNPQPASFGGKITLLLEIVFQPLSSGVQ